MGRREASTGDNKAKQISYSLLILFTATFLALYVKDYVTNNAWIICGTWILSAAGLYLLLFQVLKRREGAVGRDIALCTVLAIITVVALGGSVVPLTVPVEIELIPKGEKNEASQSTEIWLLNISVDGHEQALAQLGEKEDWVYKPESDDYVFISNDDVNEPLVIRLNVGETVKLTFLKHNWSGIVGIRYNDRYEEIDLYDAEGGTMTYTVPITGPGILSARGILMFVCSVCLICLSLYLIVCGVRWRGYSPWPTVIAVCHCVITFRTDRWAFLANSFPEPEYMVLKGLLFIALAGIWNAVFKLARGLRDGDNWCRAWIRYFCVYWGRLTLIMICLWPGNWLWDDIFIFIDASYLRFTPWQHILSSVFHILAYMMIPIPAGVVIVQYTLIAVITAYILAECDRRFNGHPMTWFLLIPFLLFPVLSFSFYPLRLSIYAFIELLFLFMLMIRKGKDSIPNAGWLIGIAMLNVLLVTWRSEGIFFIILGPVLLYLALPRNKRLKYTCVVTCILLTGYIGISALQNYYIGNKRDYYGISAYIESIDDLIRTEYSENGNSEILQSIEGFTDIQTIMDTQTGEQAFWQGVYSEADEEEEYKALKRAFVALVMKHPATFLKERVLTFLDTSACTQRSDRKSVV